MSEPRSDIRRVAFDLSAEHIPELMGVLGDFVASHSIKIEFDNPEPLAEQETRYNPELVDWLVDPANGAEVAVVTRPRLVTFEKKRATESPENGRTTTRAVRLFNATTRFATWPDNAVYPFVVVADNGVVGLRADSLRLFAEALTTKSIDITNVGERGGEFLLDVCKELYLDTA